LCRSAGEVKFDIAASTSKSAFVNIFLTGPMEKFVRQKVAAGEYKTAGEVVRDALRLLRHRDEVWKNVVRDKIKAGIGSIRAGRAVSADQAKTEKIALKKR
jgi:putative addiction module CopG family antidote